MQLPPASDSGSAARAERRTILALGAFTLLAAAFTALLGYFIAPALSPPSQFVGAAYNIDDYCNYLSWLRQTTDGHFFLRSLFTTDPQNPIEFNVFFWLLGRIASLFHLASQTVLFGSRLVGGAVLLWLIARLYALCLPDNRAARLTAFGFACLSSGLGWLQWRSWYDRNLAGGPVDAWQPEAYTFLTLDTSALMTVSTCFIVGALYALLRGEMTGKWRYAVIAGLCGAVLGNMHSYDVLHLSAAWGLFLVVWTVVRRGKDVARTWLRALVALGLTLPTTVYQYIVFSRDAVFHKRANVATLSPAFWHYITGYGIVMILAVAAIVILARRPRSALPVMGPIKPPPLLFACCWAVAGLLIAYLEFRPGHPVAFQRKMLMGEHVPLCLLAGAGAAWLTQTLPGRMRAIVLAALVALSMPSNVLFVARDIRHLIQNRSETSEFPFLPDTLIDSFHWIDVNTPRDAAVVGSPILCAYLPGYAGHAVWAGHWGETPAYGDKVRAYSVFQDPNTPDSARHAFLLATHASYLLYPNDVAAGYTTKDGVHHGIADLVHRTPPYLSAVYANKNFTVFRIVGADRNTVALERSANE